MPELYNPRSLSSLPDELLIEISLEVVLEASDLRSLALVNRRFSRCMRLSLYDTIGCNLCRYTATRNLIRTLQTHPDLGLLVRAMFIYVYAQDQIEMLSADDFDEATKLLRSIPALKHLQLEISTPFENCVSNLTDILKPSLRSIDLGVTVNLVVEDVGKLMRLPNIRTLKINSFSDSSDSVIKSAEWSGNSSLKRLELHCEESHMIMPELPPLPQGLEEIMLDLNFDEELQNLSPKAMSCALAPTSSTLKTLSLSGFFGVDLKTDGSWMDFSCFTSLKFLTVLSVYCFPLRYSQHLSEKRGFHRRLPATLVKLEVHFIACSPLALEYDDALESEDHYQWILELATEKAQRLQNLTIVELTGHEYAPFAQVIEWRYPVDVKLAFDTVNVHLSVMLYSEG